MPETDATNPAAGWIPARLIPTAGIKGQAEQEARATSALLAVLTAVPDFAHRVLTAMGAPRGRLSTYTEVRLKGSDGATHIPDGAVVVERGRRRWSCLVEVKTSTARLETEQVHRYLDMARQHGFDGVLTISNQIVADVDALPYKVNGVKVGKLTVRHLSWWQILTEAVIQHRFRGVVDPDQAWILNELIRYLTDERSGASGFEGMGPDWVRLRDAARNGTLRPADSEVALVAARWEQLLEYLCLTLSQELGVAVKRMRPRGKSSRRRLEESVSLLATRGVLRGSFRVPKAVAPIHLEADLGARKVTTSVDLDAPSDRKQARSRITWLLRQLKEAPEDLRIDVRFSRRHEGRSELLKDVREAPDALLLPEDPRCQPRSFTLARVGKMGAKKGRGEGSFVDETCRQATVFYRDLVQDLRTPQPKAPQLAEESTPVEDPASPEERPPESESSVRREQGSSYRTIAELFGEVAASP